MKLVDELLDSEIKISFEIGIVIDVNVKVRFKKVGRCSVGR